VIRAFLPVPLNLFLVSPKISHSKPRKKMASAELTTELIQIARKIAKIAWFAK
jgi:hypothetical protein